MALNAPAAAALLAALLFGVSTPLAKLLVASVHPLYLAGLLYAGSGLGLSLLRLLRDRRWQVPSLSSHDAYRFLAACACGGMLAPLLLMVGLRHTSAAHASLLLNLEAVLTACIAWLAFGENAGRRVVAGMLLIILGGVILSWSPTGPTEVQMSGALAIAAACVCWALDNNLTRDIAGNDALFLAAGKGLIAGATNLGIATAVGAPLPTTADAVAAMGLGLTGYGLSLVLFILALRGLGAARTGAYFSTAPFVGAVIAVLLLHEASSWSLWAAGICMAAGVWLHLTETHQHRHTHHPQQHGHWHWHDAHHHHDHPQSWPPSVPHAHPHDHETLTHSHAHVPDLHHRHPH
ncbi:MAG: DMT family transporter [Gammaproteobacteria bacterium]|nr:DMT family transporter [Gammaproteobacteria bacterium]